MPKWAYGQIWDEKSRATAISSDDLRRTRVQDGVKEYLLCEGCEQRLGRLDNGFKRLPIHQDGFPGGALGLYIECRDLPFAVMKDFLLSVLWRAHVSSRAPLAAVDLHDAAEVVRAHLNGETVRADVYEAFPVFCYALQDPLSSGLARQMVLTPVKTLTNSKWCYLVAFFGFAWKIFLAGERGGLPESCELKRDGRLIIPVVLATDVPAIRDLLLA